MNRKFGIIWWLRYLRASLAYHRWTAIKEVLDDFRMYQGLPKHNTTSIGESKEMRVRTIIREKRTEIGISQAELGRRVGVTQGAVMKWETGRSYPSLDKAVQIAEALNCRIDDLIQKDGVRSSLPEGSGVVGPND